MATWQKFIDRDGNFAMSGVFTDNHLYLGGYGSGELLSWKPLVLEANDTGEAVLSMCVFKNNIFCTSENNSPDGDHTRVLRRASNGAWVESAFPGYAAYFMCVWGDWMVVTSSPSRAVNQIDVWFTKDGINWTRGPRFDDWVWVPVVSQGVLYLLGHSGPADGDGRPMAKKWVPGGSFVDVPALCNTAGVTEWQCAVEHNGSLYLGAGGWVLGRGTSRAAVYKFDGTNCTPVKIDDRFHEVQAVLSSKFNNVLYATFGAGFKSDNGGSMIWASKDNGATWVIGGIMDCPQLYVMIDTPYGYVAAGGRQGRTAAYFYDTGTPPPAPVYEHTCPRCGFKF